MTFFFSFNCRRQEEKARLESCLEKAIDIMLSPEMNVAEHQMNDEILKNLLNFSDTQGDNSFLVEEFEKKHKVISVADITTLIKNLCSSNTDAEGNFFLKKIFWLTNWLSRTPSISQPISCHLQILHYFKKSIEKTYIEVVLKIGTF